MNTGKLEVKHSAMSVYFALPRVMPIYTNLSRIKFRKSKTKKGEQSGVNEKERCWNTYNTNSNNWHN